MDKIFCTFTGHRPKSFPWKDNETAPGCVLLKETLAEQIKWLTKRGVTEFLSGMAQGVDLWAAKIVLDLRKKSPEIKLSCALPCAEQEKKWPSAVQQEYRSILTQAHKVVMVGKEYTKECMLTRNRYMVKYADILLAVYSGKYQSGTGATVRYAQKLGRKIIMIDPITRIVSHQ